MPGPLIEAATKLTKSQWQRVLKRVLQQEPRAAAEGLLPARDAAQIGAPGELTKRVQDTIFSHEPNVERTLGELYGPHPNPSLAEAGVRAPQILPIEQARAKYFQDPEGLTPGGARAPVNEISTGVAPGSPEELAQGIGYARNKFQAVVPPSVAKAAAAIRRGEVGEMAEQRLAGQGLKPEDIRTSPEQFLKTQGEKGQTVEGTQALKEVLSNAMQADQLWREMGGARTTAGQMWSKLLDLQKGGVKGAFKSGKDWFIASYNKYKRNPTEFAKKHPREASLLEKITKVVEEGE